MMAQAKFISGQLIIATEDAPAITRGTFYTAGYACTEDSRHPNSLWVTNDEGVTSIYHESIFERATADVIARLSRG